MARFYRVVSLLALLLLPGLVLTDGKTELKWYGHLACIGDHFTMGPERAALAVRLVKPKMVIPMHYGTLPVLTGTPQAFAKALGKRHAKVKLRVMKVDETLAL